MSDQLNKDEKELSFKERILRDLEALKTTIEETDQLTKSQADSQEIDDLAQSFENTQTQTSSEESPLESQAAVTLNLPQDSEQVAPQEVPPVPDFVAEQARKLSAVRTQPRVSAVPPGFKEAASQPTHKVPLTFSPEDIDPDKVASETAVVPLPKRAVDRIEDDLVARPPRPDSRSRRNRNQATVSHKGKQPKKKKRGPGRIIAGFFMTLFLLLVAAAVVGYFYIQSSLGPVDSTSTEAVQIEIPKGASVKDIAETLENSDLIKSALVFEYYVKFNNFSNFQSGYHSLNKGMDVDTIIETLHLEGTPIEEAPALGKVTIPEGYTLKQISEAITLNAQTSETTDKTPFTTEEFMMVVEDESFIAEMVAKYPDLLGSLPTKESGVLYRLEGYLFPATYEYKKDTTVAELIEQMIAAMDANLRQYYPKIAERGQTVNQILTLASLVEKEGATDEDRRNISSVFYNRMQWNMPLQSNIAILYAEGKLGEKITLSEDVSIDTQIDSPYNVYIHQGYMPGAVDNPGLSAIIATIEPTTTDYFYFVADVTTGKVYFAKTLEEHDANVQTYVNSKVQSSQ